jgi:hypothetical protein
VLVAVGPKLSVLVSGLAWVSGLRTASLPPTLGSSRVVTSYSTKVGPKTELFLFFYTSSTSVFSLTCFIFPLPLVGRLGEEGILTLLCTVLTVDINKFWFT